MPRYEVIGTGRGTGRRRKRVYSCLAPQDAAKLANDEGIEVETVKSLPEKPATEKQVAYARDLGLSFPNDISKAEMMDLLDAHLSSDRGTTERDRAFARIFGLETTRYVGKKAMFDAIGNALRAPGREHELAAWFAFRVLRHLLHGGEDHPAARGPDAPVIVEIADALASDERTIRSIRGYHGRQLIWFGEYTAPDGSVHEGGSTRTIAYRRARDLLIAKLGVQNESLLAKRPRSASKTSVGSRSHPETRRKQGCLGILLLVLLVSLTILAAWGAV